MVQKNARDQAADIEPQLLPEEEIFNEACSVLGSSYSAQPGRQNAISPIFGELLALLAKALMGYCSGETGGPITFTGEEVQRQCERMQRHPLLTRRPRMRLRSVGLDFLLRNDPAGKVDIDDALSACIRAGATAQPAKLQTFMESSL